MARRRFFVEEIRRGAAEVEGAEAEHLTRVLRVESGQRFEISDNRRVYLAEIETARKSSVIFRVLEELPAAPESVTVLLYPALIKFERYEWLVEKATEQGASLLQPFAAARTEHGLAQASHKRVERWRKIAFEASQQARRDRLPQVEAALRSFDAIETDAGVRLLLDEDPEASPILRVLPEKRTAADRVAVLLGPEGGWTAEERAAMVAAGWKACRLGPTVLRAETAAVAALAVIRAAWDAI